MESLESGIQMSRGHMVRCGKCLLKKEIELVSPDDYRGMHVTLQRSS